MTLARIVPGPIEGDGAQGTMGTKVMVGDQALGGVYRIELVAQVNDVWRAIIHCHVRPEDVLADAEVVETPPGVGGSEV